MPTFYPHEDDLEASSLQEKIEILMEGAERFKASVLEEAGAQRAAPEKKKRTTPRDIQSSYNWNEIAKVLAEVRDMPEANQVNKLAKAETLTKLAAIYEVLRGAKMPKLEAVRLALINEANQLKG